jgi:hypothetical protein
VFSGIHKELFDDPEFKEDSVRETIIAPMLTRLGYLPSGPCKVIRSKTLKHPFIRVGVRNFPVHLVPDYTLLHNDRPIFVLDAKAPNESILEEAHIQQVYSYAVHPELQCKEFGLCNGRQLAVFDTSKNRPILLVEFSDFEFRWAEIEKYLSVKYLIKPELRGFRPDFGFKLKQLAYGSKTDMTFPGARLDIFGRVSNELFTAGANCDLEGEIHAVSFDFSAPLLVEAVAGLPGPLKKMFLDALNRAPFTAAAELVVEVDLTAALGEEAKGTHESFVPLVVKKVHASRFNPSVVPDYPNDRPSEMFQLRKAFKIVDHNR